MRRLLTGALALVLAAACGGGDESTPPPPPTYTISGVATLAGQASSASLVVTLVGPSTAAAVTAADGSYSFTGAGNGTYAVTAVADSTLERSRTVAVTVDGADATAEPIAFTPVGSLTGRVTLGAATGNAGISVIVSGTGAAGVTDDAGSYTLTDVPAGSHDVVATLPGYAAGISPAVAVPFDATGNVPDLVLAPGGTASIRGSAFLAGGGAAVGATVTVDGTAFTTTVGADGSFELLGLPDGAYSVTIDAGEYHERIPGVITVAGGSGYLLDGSLYPMLPIDLPRGTRIASEYVGDGWSVAPGGHAVAFKVDPTLAGSYTLEVAAVDGAVRVVAQGVTGHSWNSDGSRVWAWTRDPSTSTGDVLIHTVATGETRVVASAVANLYNLSWVGNDWVRIDTYDYATSTYGYSLASAAGATIPLGSSIALFGHDAATNRYLWGTVVDSANGVATLELADLTAGTTAQVAANVYYYYTANLGTAGAFLFFDAPSAGRGTLKLLNIATGALQTVEADSKLGGIYASPNQAKVLFLGTGDVLKLMTVATAASVQVATNVYSWGFANDAGAWIQTDRDTVTGRTTLRYLDVAAATTTLVTAAFAGRGDSPNGTHVYHLSNYDSTTGSYTLGVFTVASKSNYPSVATGVRDWPIRWAPNENRVQFLKTDGALYSYLVGGTPNLVAAATVNDYEVTPDSARAIVYRGAAYPVYGTVGRVSLGGGAETTVASNVYMYNRPRSADGAVQYFLSAFNGTTYMGTLRAVNLSTGAATDMASNVYSMAPSPDSAGVLFWTDYNTTTGLGTAKVAAAYSTTPTQIGTSSLYYEYQFSPDGHTATVRLGRYYDDADQVYEGYVQSVPVIGGTLGPYVYGVYEWWTANDRFFAKVYYNRANGSGYLYSVPFTGSYSQLGSNVHSSSVATSPDGARLSFVRNWDQARGTGVLSTVRVTETARTDVLDRTASHAWFNDGTSDRILAYRKGTPPPFRFQDGLYLMAPLP